MAIRPLHTGQDVTVNTDAIESQEIPHDVEVGSEIRTLRKAHGLTLKDVAARADISVGYLSEIERDITQVPIAVLRRLCEVFNVSIGWLLGVSRTGPEHERNVILRQADRTRLTFPGLGISEELLSPDLSGPLEMLISTLEPGADSDFYSHHGYEAGLVIEGVLELWIDGVQHALNSGDSFSFPSTKQHRCVNPSKKLTKVLWIITPPHY
jgi:transcriptional regulator with XRE-family HTH domain